MYEAGSGEMKILLIITLHIQSRVFKSYRAYVWGYRQYYHACQAAEHRLGGNLWLLFIGTANNAQNR